MMFARVKKKYGLDKKKQFYVFAYNFYSSKYQSQPIFPSPSFHMLPYVPGILAHLNTAPVLADALTYLHGLSRTSNHVLASLSYNFKVLPYFSLMFYKFWRA